MRAISYLAAVSVLATSLLGTAPASSLTCAALAAPVDAPIVRHFAPIGSYAGHWGIDYDVPVGSAVAAADSGAVTFAGSVAGMLTVTVDHGGGLKTSYSYLTEVAVAVGERVRPGSIVGRSGRHHEVAALHFSTRLDGIYQDPIRWLRCGGPPADALRLAPAYPLGRATRHPRRDFRPATFWTSIYGRGCLLATGTRRRHLHAGRGAVAEGRSQRR